MLGINQTIMLALSKLVITALAAAAIAIIAERSSPASTAWVHARLGLVR
jgi:hypothetical protein